MNTGNIDKKARKAELQGRLIEMAMRLNGAKQYVQPIGWRKKNGPPLKPVTIDSNGVMITEEEMEQYDRDAKELSEINDNGGNPLPQVKSHPNTVDESSLSGMPCSADFWDRFMITAGLRKLYRTATHQKWLFSAIWSAKAILGKWRGNRIT